MSQPKVEMRLAGLAYLAAATALLQRVRVAHPTAGLLEAADVQWWWRSPRSTDRVPQPFWFDASGRPVAAVIATDWGEAVALDPIVLPDVAPSWVARVVEIGVGHAQAVALGPLEVVVDRADCAMRALLIDPEGRAPVPAAHRLTGVLELPGRIGSRRCEVRVDTWPSSGPPDWA